MVVMKSTLNLMTQKSIGNSRTLASDTDDYDEIRSMIIYLCQEVSERASSGKNVRVNHPNCA